MPPSKYMEKKKTDYDEFRGFTMSSNYNKYGAISDGYYDVAYDKKGKSGAIPSNYAVESRKPIDCLDNINYAYINKVPGAHSPTQKDGFLYIEQIMMVPQGVTFPQDVH